MIDKVKQGKKNRKSGKYFEKKVQADLEKKGWIVARWNKNVEKVINNNTSLFYLKDSKPKFNPFTKSLMMNSSGFPDFITFHPIEHLKCYECCLVECKKGKYLSAEEKEKCEWYLKNTYFRTLIVAYPGRKRGEIIYETFKN